MTAPGAETFDHSAELAGEVVLITGSATGQGASHARAFHAAGATVVVTDVQDEQGAALVADLGDRASYHHLDVTDPAAWRRVVDAVENDAGPIGILVNNAGIVRRGTVHEVDPDDFRQVLEVNLMGCLHGLQAVTPQFRRRGGGAVVNIASMVGLVGRPNGGGYTTSKWALRGLTRCAAADLAPFGVRVNAVLPGIIDTPMVVGPSNTAEDAVARHADRLLIPRLGSPADITAAVLFLSSARAAYITGTDFVVDGGWTVT